MTTVLERERHEHRTAGPREIHCACLLHPHVGLCGEPRNGRPAKPGATVTCVVCADLKAAMFCPRCNPTNKED